MGWASGSVDTTMKQRLLAMPYQDALWRTRYPKLIGILDDEPAAPKGNTIARNISWHSRWDEIEGKARPYLTFADNLIDEDPHFVNAGKLGFQLKDDSPAYRMGFQRIPVEKIGLYRSEQRASWPVKATVREVPAPPPPLPGRTGPPPVFKVPRAKAAVTVDGTIAPAEWDGARASSAMLIAQGIEGEKVRPTSRAWLAHDDASLLVAFDNAVDASKPLQMGNQWGRDDAVEVAIRNAAGGEDAPILVLRGYPSGHFESSAEAGAPADAVRRAGEGVEYKARVVSATHWTAEWRIPFASLGIDPARQTRFAVNLSVRKTAPEPLWLMWQGTGGHTWDIEDAGVIELVR
jgi:hypothetical protein